MLTRNILFTFLLDGSKSSPRQSQACSETKSYHDDGDDDGDEYTACACQRWMFVTIFMPIFVVLSILGFIFVLLLMPCKYQLHHCISFFFFYFIPIIPRWVVLLSLITVSRLSTYSTRLFFCSVQYQGAWRLRRVSLASFWLFPGGPDRAVRGQRSIEPVSSGSVLCPSSSLFVKQRKLKRHCSGKTIIQ